MELSRQNTWTKMKFDVRACPRTLFSFTPTVPQTCPGVSGGNLTWTLNTSNTTIAYLFILKDIREVNKVMENEERPWKNPWHLRVCPGV